MSSTNRVYHGAPEVRPIEGTPGADPLIDALANILARVCARELDQDPPPHVLELPRRPRKKAS